MFIILFKIHFYNSFNISSLFSDGINISSIFLKFSSITGFVFTFLLAILFPINLPVASAALWTTFQKTVFKASSLLFNNWFLYLLDKFLENDENPYHLTYFLVLGSIEYCVISISKQCQFNFFFYF